MTIEEIRQLIDLANESGVAELEVERSGNRVRIRRAPTHQEIVLHPVSPAATNAHMPVAPPQSPAQAGAAPPVSPTPLEDANLIYVKSPIVGTYYESPSPSDPPFVNIGDTIRTGQVLCIIESMKLMNEIESEISGVVVQKLVKNAQPVEYGESLLAIRPS
jgi:acetyl-CoA carboxylase biotin carboxyl carrier protein